MALRLPTVGMFYEIKKCGESCRCVACFLVLLIIDPEDESNRISLTSSRRKQFFESIGVESAIPHWDPTVVACRAPARVLSAWTTLGG